MRKHYHDAIKKKETVIKTLKKEIFINETSFSLPNNQSDEGKYVQKWNMKEIEHSGLMLFINYINGYLTKF